MTYSQEVLTVIAAAALLAGIVLGIGWYLDPVRTAGWFWCNTRIRSVCLQDGQLFQRRGRAAENIAIAGRVGLFAKSVEVAVVSDEVRSVGPLAWSCLDAQPRLTDFRGSITIPEGWANVYLRSAGQGHRVSGSIRAGAGEVFIVAGQSNASGSDPALYLARNPSVRCGHLGAGGAIAWTTGSDPQVPGGGGSVWPAVGRQIEQQLRVPIGFINIAVGSTSIREWQPGTRNFQRLVRTVEAVRPLGVRAILWHQGENDRGMPRREYYNHLQRLIAGCSQAVLPDKATPWLVATASYVSGNIGARVREAQQQICAEGLAFAGPDTDTIGREGRDDTDIHLGGEGTLIAAQLWCQNIMAAFFSNAGDARDFPCSAQFPCEVWDSCRERFFDTKGLPAGTYGAINTAISK